MSSKLPERRRTPRRGATDHGVVAAKIRPGHHVTLIDLSTGGALLEGERRLLPGTAVELQIHGKERHATLRGCVVRCTVVRVRAASVCYRGAIAFDRDLPWFVDTAGYDIPGRGDATPQVL